MGYPGDFLQLVVPHYRKSIESLSKLFQSTFLKAEERRDLEQHLETVRRNLAQIEEWDKQPFANPEMTSVEVLRVNLQRINQAEDWLFELNLLCLETAIANARAGNQQT